MPSICFYFQVHQPYRLRNYTIFELDNDYFDDSKNAEICKRVARKCYLPSNLLMLELIRKHKGKFRISYSITGVLLEQLELYAPEVLASFQALAATNCVEFLAETYYHSLSFLYSREEFIEQIQMHKQTIHRLFSQTPRVFRNTELIYNNDLATVIEQMGGFDMILAEGADHILGYRSPNFVYRPPNSTVLRLLLKNYRLSDDIAFRFSNRNWSQWPVTADRFAAWINAFNGNGFVVNLFMDYETLGEHQWEDTGIFSFMRHLPSEILKHPDNAFGEQHGSLAVDVGNQQCKFVASQAGHGIRVAESLLHSVSHLLQEQIAAAVPQGVINFLETVEIQYEQGNGFVVPACLEQRLVEPFV